METRKPLNFRLSPRTAPNLSISEISPETTRLNTYKPFPWGEGSFETPKITKGGLERKTEICKTTSPQCKIDSRTYIDINSKGLASRIVKYHENSLKLNRSLSVGNLYNKHGQFPVVHLKKNEIKASRNKNISMVRIAPPDKMVYQSNSRTNIFRSGSIAPVCPQKADDVFSRENRPILHPADPNENKLTRSVLDDLKEISRKRINSDDPENNDAMKKYCRETRIFSYTPSTITSTSIPQASNLLYGVSTLKRQREFSSASSTDLTALDDFSRKRRMFSNINNDISSSLSSSINILQKQKMNKVENKFFDKSKTLVSPASPPQNQKELVTPQESSLEIQKQGNSKEQYLRLELRKDESTVPNSPKQKLTLFNKKYDDTTISKEIKTSPSAIRFVKPKESIPESAIKGHCARNALIEKTQKSKLALMLSGLRGELDTYNEEDSVKVATSSDSELNLTGNANKSQTPILHSNINIDIEKNSNNLEVKSQNSEISIKVNGLIQNETQKKTKDVVTISSTEKSENNLRDFNIPSLSGFQPSQPKISSDEIAKTVVQSVESANQPIVQPTQSVISSSDLTFAKKDTLPENSQNQKPTTNLFDFTKITSTNVNLPISSIIDKPLTPLYTPSTLKNSNPVKNTTNPVSTASNSINLNNTFNVNFNTMSDNGNLKSALIANLQQNPGTLNATINENQTNSFNANINTSPVTKPMGFSNLNTTNLTSFSNNSLTFSTSAGTNTTSNLNVIVPDAKLKMNELHNNQSSTIDESKSMQQQFSQKSTFAFNANTQNNSPGNSLFAFTKKTINSPNQFEISNRKDNNDNTKPSFSFDSANFQKRQDNTVTSKSSGPRGIFFNAINQSDKSNKNVNLFDFSKDNSSNKTATGLATNNQKGGFTFSESAPKSFSFTAANASPNSFNFTSATNKVITENSVKETTTNTNQKFEFGKAFENNKAVPNAFKFGESANNVQETNSSIKPSFNFTSPGSTGSTGFNFSTNKNIPEINTNNPPKPSFNFTAAATSNTTGGFNFSIGNTQNQESNIFTNNGNDVNAKPPERLIRKATRRLQK